jgi:hypothetical protein
VDGKKLRISFILYTRKSIADFFVRRGHYGPAFEWIFSCFEELRRSTKPVDQLHQSVLKDYAGLRCSELAPNLDPAVHHSLMVDCVLRMHAKHHLTLVEMHSVMMAFAYIPGAPFFVVHAAESIALCKLRRGPMLGYCLLDHAIALWDAKGKGSGRPQRYNMYFTVSLPEKSVFLSNTMKSARVSLLLFRDHCKPPNGGIERRRLYKRVQKRFQAGVNNFGGLGSNHLLGAMSLLGLVPSWLYYECTLDASSKGFQFICTNFKVPTGSTGADPFFKTLTIALSRRYGVLFLPRFVENLICKCFQRFGRVNKEHTNTFHDMLIKDQRLFVPDAEGFIVVHQLNKEPVTMEGPLLKIFHGFFGKDVSFHAMAKCIVPVAVVSFDPRKNELTNADNFSIPRIVAKQYR